jgi:hypothetical protein
MYELGTMSDACLSFLGSGSDIARNVHQGRKPFRRRAVHGALYLAVYKERTLRMVPMRRCT